MTRFEMTSGPTRLDPHRSKPWLVVAVGALLGSCSHDPRVLVRTVTVNVPTSCAVTPDAVATFTAAGDFEPDPLNPPVDAHPLRDVGAGLVALPPSTRSLAIDVSQGTARWKGLADVGASGDVGVLAWPWLEPCALSQTAAAPSGAAMALIDARHALVLGGPLPPAAVDLATGIVSALAPLQRPRTGATVTPFAGGALIAGGRRATSGDVMDSAELYEPGNGNPFARLSDRPILLNVARADAGATVLSTGETLLVGGAKDDGSALGSIEIVDPNARDQPRLAAATLRVPRIAPTVLRLANGKILVAGGFLDKAKTPATTLEWFNADASAALVQLDLPAGPAGSEQGFVALEGGAVLAVTGAGTPVTAGSNVHVIRPDFTVEDAAPISPPPLLVRLFAGSDGSPVLFTGSSWLVWDPWQAQFQMLVDGVLGPVDPVTASGDPGLALWLDRDQHVKGFRFATRGAFATPSVPFLLFDTSHTAPDRVPAANGMRFDPATGLTLPARASVFVTDATFANVTIDVALSTAPVRVVLREPDGSELEVGSTGCPGASGGAATALHVERDGATVRVRAGNGAALVACTAQLHADARVSIGLRGPSEGTSGLARQLSITRRP